MLAPLLWSKDLRYNHPVHSLLPKNRHISRQPQWKFWERYLLALPDKNAHLNQPYYGAFLTSVVTRECDSMCWGSPGRRPRGRSMANLCAVHQMDPRSESFLSIGQCASHNLLLLQNQMLFIWLDNPKQTFVDLSHYSFSTKMKDAFKFSKFLFNVRWRHFFSLFFTTLEEFPLDFFFYLPYRAVWKVNQHHAELSKAPDYTLIKWMWPLTFTPWIVVTQSCFILAISIYNTVSGIYL